MTETTAGSIVHNPDSRDHFDVLGMPRLLQVDEKLLADNYYALSRLYHPDFHQTASVSERAASLRRTAAVNDAYQTLRDPVARGRWWLELNGVKLSQSNQVPRDLVMLVFEVQDDLAELSASKDPKAAARVRERRKEVESVLRGRTATLAANFAKWDEGNGDRRVLLDELREALAGISYIRTLLRDTDKVLESTED